MGVMSMEAATLNTEAVRTSETLTATQKTNLPPCEPQISNPVLYYW
jgi:hypothetical protein